MKFRLKRRAVLLMAAALTLVLLCVAFADDKGDQYVVSNTLSIEDVATLATGVEDTGDGIPEGATRVRVDWLPNDTNAPESAVVIIAGSGTPEKVILTAEDGWQKTVKLAKSTVPYSVTLLYHNDYEVIVENGSMLIKATLPKEDEEEEEEMLTVVEPGDGAEGSEETKEYGVSITANVHETDTLYFGMQIVLTAQPTGYDDVEYTLVWQCDKGSGWEVIEGATGATHAFTLTVENASWAYRVEVVPAE